MGKFLVPVNGVKIPVEAASREEAAALAPQIFLDMQARQNPGVDDYGHPLSVRAPQGDNEALRYAKEFSKGAVSGLAAANPIDIMMNAQGYLADKISQATGWPRGADIRQKMQGGGQGWVERNVLPPPVEGYEGVRHAGEFVGGAVLPTGIYRGALAAPEVPNGARTLSNAAGALMRGAGRDLATAGTGVAASMGGGAALGGAGRLAGQLTGSPYADALEAAGDVVGTIGGGIYGARAADNAFRDAATRTRRFPGSEQNVGTLRQNDIPLTAGQELNNKSLRASEDVAAALPGGSYAGDILRNQSAAMARAAARLMGYDMQNPEQGLWTPEEWLGAKRMFQRQYGDLTGRNNIHIDQDALSDFHRAYGSYNDNLGPMNSSTRDIVARRYNDLTNGGLRTLPGRQYQTWYSQLGDDINYNADHLPTKSALIDMRQALVDTMGRSLRGEDAVAWQDLNRRYSNYKTVQHAAFPAGGEAAANFELPWSRIRAVAAHKNPTAFLEGNSDMGNLARAHDGVLQPPRSSGTAERTLAQNLNLSGVGAGVGGAVGAMGGPVGGAIGAVLGSAAPAIVNKFQGSALGQRLARGAAAIQPLDGGPGFAMFQRYAPTAGTAMPAPVELPMINVPGQGGR